MSALASWLKGTLPIIAREFREWLKARKTSAKVKRAKRRRRSLLGQMKATWQRARQFAARRAYKRALRRARNPLYFSTRSLALLIIL